MAAVTLLIVSIWLKSRGRPFLIALIPMALVTSVTAWAMIGNLVTYFSDFAELWLLAISGSLILVFDCWIVVEGLRLLGAPGVAQTEPATRA